jgi:hypothetical protein
MMEIIGNPDPTGCSTITIHLITGPQQHSVLHIMIHGSTIRTGIMTHGFVEHHSSIILHIIHRIMVRRIIKTIGGQIIIM